MKQFYKVVANTLVANVTSNFLWFALVFWAYLETNSVLVTGVLGGIFMLIIAVISIPFGTLVDKHHKKPVMVWTTAVATGVFALAALIYLVLLNGRTLDWLAPSFWVFSVLVLAGAVVMAMRNIVLSTVVTILVPEDKHANANGMVGTVQGIGFLVTAVFSGLAVGYLGMGWVLVISVALTGLALLHMTTIAIPEAKIVHDPELAKKKVDIKGSLSAIGLIPGLMGLIVFTTFNNLIGGVYMALLDPYGLNLLSVQMWGILTGVGSIGIIIGGLVIAAKGLGKKPLRTLLIVNIIIGIIGGLIGIRESWLILGVCMFAYMLLIPVVEATEQTIIQKVVPLKQQGRVFGFAAAFESMAAPITSFFIAPLAQFIIIPFMESDQGRANLGWLLGEGRARGIALVFVVAGLVMVLAALLAFMTKSYRQLSQVFVKEADR